MILRFEPPHDKTNKMTVHPAKTQISLGIRLVWSESSLCSQWVVKGPMFLHVESEYSVQTGRMPRLIWVFAGRTCHFVGFVMRRLISDRQVWANSVDPDETEGTKSLHCLHPLDTLLLLRMYIRQNRSNFGEVDVAPAKNDKANKVEKWQKLTAGLNPNHMHIFKPWKKRCAKLHKDRHEIV